MIISSQGFGHFTQGINNQDFGIETPNMILILDGCSGSKCAEVGTRLFAQLFKARKGFDNVEKFEENVKAVFEDIISFIRYSYHNDEDAVNAFIMDNLLFTIFACFNEKDKFVVKILGDGYIVSQNINGLVSYMRLHYGDYPPYFAYRFCKFDSENLCKVYPFKTFTFPKDKFSKVGVATDGIAPIAKGEIKGLDENLVRNNEIASKFIINSNRQSFYDDVTVGIHDTEVKNGKEANQ